MSTSLSSLADNLSEIYKKECKLCEERKIMSECRVIGLKNNELYYKCKKCSNESYKSVNGLIKKFPRIYQFCDGDFNEFVLLLRKGVYPYQHMNSWEKSDKTSLLDKIYFYSELNLESINDKDYSHAQKVFKEFCTYIGDYHDLHVQCDTLFLADVFQNFRDKCIEIYMDLILLNFCQVQD